jgi:hypothetical protein
LFAAATKPPFKLLKVAVFAPDSMAAYQRIPWQHLLRIIHLLGFIHFPFIYFKFALHNSFVTVRLGFEPLWQVLVWSLARVGLQMCLQVCDGVY